jgi:ribosome-associated protein
VTDREIAERAGRLAEAALDKKAEDVVALDLRELSSFVDLFVIATGTSDRHVRSIVDGVAEALRAGGERVLAIEGEEEGRWVLMDLGDAVVHVFQRDVRALYDLERLWGDAPRLARSSPGSAQRSAP